MSDPQRLFAQLIDPGSVPPPRCPLPGLGGCHYREWRIRNQSSQTATNRKYRVLDDYNSSILPPSTP